MRVYDGDTGGSVFLQGSHLTLPGLPHARPGEETILALWNQGGLPVASSTHTALPGVRRGRLTSGQVAVRPLLAAAQGARLSLGGASMTAGP